MARFSLLAVLLSLVPVAAHAQPRLMVGGGFSAPSGHIADVADPGYHLRVGLQVAIPNLPLGLRADGDFHRMGAASAEFSRTEILDGALSLAFTLPGVGLQPYLLAGIGSYRTKSGPSGSPETVTDTGYHGGFGVVIGGLGMGAFAELRYIQIQSVTKTRLIPLTVGLRF